MNRRAKLLPAAAVAITACIGLSACSTAADTSAVDPDNPAQPSSQPTSCGTLYGGSVSEIQGVDCAQIVAVILANNWLPADYPSGDLPNFKVVDPATSEVQIWDSGLRTDDDPRVTYGMQSGQPFSFIWKKNANE
ncbi:MAG: hypothetical protein HQ526_07405 [Actinobacteria bacterium]|nr:hypothetical protein [Actinomycetota bacterium]